MNTIHLYIGGGISIIILSILVITGILFLTSKNCVLNPPLPSTCTDECKITQTVKSPKSGVFGKACPPSSYKCKGGDGQCPEYIAGCCTGRNTSVIQKAKNSKCGLACNIPNVGKKGTYGSTASDPKCKNGDPIYSDCKGNNIPNKYVPGPSTPLNSTTIT